MDYRNADGSLAEMCGNSVRVVGKYLGGRGLVGGSLDLETRAEMALELHADDRGGVDQVTVDMGAPVLEDERTLDVDGEPVTATVLSMGNPHAVVFVDDVDKAPVTTAGPHPGDPPGVLSPDQRRVRPGGRRTPSASGPGAGRRRDPGPQAPAPARSRWPPRSSWPAARWSSSCAVAAWARLVPRRHRHAAGPGPRGRRHPDRGLPRLGSRAGGSRRFVPPRSVCPGTA